MSALITEPSLRVCRQMPAIVRPVREVASLRCRCDSSRGISVAGRIARIVMSRNSLSP